MFSTLVSSWQRLNHIKRRRLLGYALRVVILAGIYVAAAKLGLALAFSTKQITTVWPPTGLALAALLVMGPRYWPGVFIGAFTANVLTNEPAAVAGGIAIGNTLEALAGAYLLVRFAGFDTSFKRVRDYFNFLLAAIICTLLSATLGTLSLLLGHIIMAKHYGHAWLIWWIGDTMGALIFAPFLLLVARPQSWLFIKNRLPEFIALLAFALSTSLLIFTQQGTVVSTLPYLVFPLLIWASLRFLQIGAATVMMIVAATAILGTVARSGPFTLHGTTEQNLIFLHSYLLVAAMTAMLMAITASERRSTERMLKAQSQDLAETNRRMSNLLRGALDTPAKKLRAQVDAEDAQD